MKLNKILLIPIFLFLLLTFVSAKDLSLDTTIIDKEYQIGNTSLSSTNIIFTNNDNSTFDLTFSIDGTIGSLVSVSPSILSFTGNIGEQKTLNVNYNIPSTTSSGIYSGKIYYGTGPDYILVYILVLEEEQIDQDKCRIVLSPNYYEYTLKKGTPTYIQSFSFRIPSDCTQGAEITQISVSGSVLTDFGFEPIRLAGAIPSGEYAKSTSVPFDVEFSSEDLSSGTYTPQVNINAIDLENDEVISNVLNFKMQIVGQATPIPDVVTPPIFDPIPQDLSLNETYVIVARNVDPNINIIVEPNPYIYGEKVELSSDTWTYKFRGVKVGNTIIRVYASLLGGVIGSPVEQEVRIIQGALPTGGVNLSLEFFPSLENIKSGQEVNVLVKDAKNQNIITTYNLWLNGIKVEGNSFNPESGDQLKVNVEGYTDYTHVFSISKKQMSINLNPAEPKINENLTITIIDINNQNDITNSSVIKFNGNQISGNTIVPKDYGSFLIKAFCTGYKNVERNITLTQSLEITVAIPTNEEIKLGDEINLPLSISGSWTVNYIKDEESVPETLAEGDDDLIVFNMNNPGTYNLYLGGDLYYSWEIRGGFVSRVLSYWWVGLIIIGIIVVLYLINKSGILKEGGEEGDDEKEAPYAFDTGPEKKK